MQVPQRTLNNGFKIPGIGFGTYKSTQETADVLDLAIKAGYRYFDTAAFYKNEQEVGRALKESGLPREAFWVASKVWKTDLGYEQTKASFERSRQLLDLSYLDVYLIHWPKKEPGDPDWKARMWDTWRAMEELYEQGNIKAIGVSNFLPHHLEALMEKARIYPAIDQLEIHPGYWQREAVRYCQDKQIPVQAWSPMGRGRVLADPLLTEMAGRYQVSVAQLCLQFVLQLGAMPLPKASSEERMRQNLLPEPFTISGEDMKRLLNMPETGWSGEHPDRETVCPES